MFYVFTDVLRTERSLVTIRLPILIYKWEGKWCSDCFNHWHPSLNSGLVGHYFSDPLTQLIQRLTSNFQISHKSYFIHEVTDINKMLIMSLMKYLPNPGRDEAFSYIKLGLISTEIMFHPYMKELVLSFMLYGIISTIQLYCHIFSFINKDNSD